MIWLSRRCGRLQTCFDKCTAFLKARLLCRGVHNLYGPSNRPHDGENKAALLKSLALNGAFWTFSIFDTGAWEKAARAGTNNSDLILGVPDECIIARANDIWAIQHPLSENRYFVAFGFPLRAVILSNRAHDPFVQRIPTNQKDTDVLRQILKIALGWV